MGKFVSKLNFFCNNSKEVFREHENHIWFKDGFALATNGAIAIKQKLELSGFTIEEIEILEGKAISVTAFKEIYRAKEVFATADGFKTNDGTYAYKTITTVDFDIVINSINKQEFTAFNKLALNSQNVCNISKGIYQGEGKILELNFKSSNVGILITSQGTEISEQMVLLMPNMIEE